VTENFRKMAKLHLLVDLPDNARKFFAPSNDAELNYSEYAKNDVEFYHEINSKLMVNNQ
jgi:hypothetical protein